MAGGSAGRQVAFRQHGVISVAVDGLGDTQRDLSTIGKAGAEVQMQLADAGMQASKKFDERSKQSFQTLKDDMKAAEAVAAEGRQKALSALQQTANLPPPQPTPAFEAEFPDIAKEHSTQLNAMEANMADYRARMAEAGVDVGDAATMQEDIGATFGGESDERRKGIAVLDDMLHKQKGIAKEQKKLQAAQQEEVDILQEKFEKQDAVVKQVQSERTVVNKKLKEEEAKYDKIKDKKSKEAKDTLKNIKEIKKEQKEINNTVKREEASRRKLKGQLGEEEKILTEINENVAHTEARVESLIDDKNKQLNTDRSLSAVESKRRKDESKGQQDYKRREKENNQERRTTNDLLKTRGNLSAQYNRQVEAMATSFKTTLVGALAVSTAATAAFFNKLDGVRQAFMSFEEELMNAQSIFQANQKTLFGLSDQIVSFGNQYGISMQDASQGLYTLASAGLDAEESMMVLNNTLKLSMAVQGDHETIAKLTTQTIFGFGLQMSDSAELTDKFAHAINKSLIEYQDLASAVKFAMPFFVSTGQNIDQLLGSLEILTNRALEAGIAGRGLRQALAEFAQHAEDNTAAFAKMGVEITNADGSFKQLTEIAKQFQEAMGPAASDVDLMTTLLEDLNVRGATAFVHLVQNADEFEHAVQDLANSSGAATEMADIQQQSLARSIQLIKNSLQSPFLMSDAVGKQAGHLNEFAMVLHNITEEFHGMIVVMQDGVAVGLTPLGKTLKEFVISALHEFHDLVKVTMNAIEQLSEEGHDLSSVIRLMTVPLKLAVKLFAMLGPRLIEYIIIFKTLNALIPIQNMLMAFRLNLMDQEAQKALTNMLVNIKLKNTMKGLAAGYSHLALSQMGSMAILLAMTAITERYAKGQKDVAAVIGAVAGAFIGAAMAIQLYNASFFAAFTPMQGWFIAAALIATTMATFALLNVKMQEMMKPPEITYDMGGRIYDSGGPQGGGLGSRHQQVWVEPGESIIPKTQNMLGGGGGITLNIAGDIITNDADDFAERIAIALPQALRMQNDIGGI